MITVYTSIHCRFCTQMKEWLKEKEIRFEEKNVLEDAVLQELKERGVKSIPHTVIKQQDNIEEFTGFDEGIKNKILRSLN